MLNLNNGDDFGAAAPIWCCGSTRRPGTEYLGEVKDSDDITRLIPFQFKTSDTYILSFGDSVMRVFRNGQQVLNSSSKAITGITQANPGVITSNSHGFSNGDEIYVSICSEVDIVFARPCYKQ